MPSLYVVEDKGTLPHLVALAGIGGKFSNIKKKIVRCGNYEFHHQHHQSAQIELLLNMFALSYTHLTLPTKRIV